MLATQLLLTTERKSVHLLLENVQALTCTSKKLQRSMFFCLNRLHPDTNVDIVTSFLKSRGVSVFSCYIVNSGSDENLSPKFISMRIRISQLDTKKIYDPDLWPAGVTVRPWSFKQRSS